MSKLNLFKKDLNLMRNQKGQTIIILLLAMLVALTIGLSLVQSSITDLANSTKIEQSSRAFSAAEAGIEQVLQNSSQTTVSSSVTGNQSNATVTVSGNQPASNVDALEYPPLGKADLSHFWLINPDNFLDIYGRGDVVIYFGNTGSKFDSNDIPAIEVNLVTINLSGNFASARYFFDPVSTRASVNNFTLVPLSNCSQNPGIGVTTSYSNMASPENRYFYCKQVLDVSPGGAIAYLLRVRLLYSNKNQSIAVGKGTQPCLPFLRCTLPPQATLYTSTGTAGQTEKILTVFKEKKVVLPFFDFAIFSNSDISK